LNFNQFNFNSALLECIESMNFNKPTPIQEQAIPVALAGNDLIAVAQTGTGKTAAFLLPIINMLYEKHGSKKTSKNIKALVLVPTRELAQQIDIQMQGLAYFIPVSSQAIYGGNDKSAWDDQKNALVSGAEVIIATPGRLLSHIMFDYADLSGIEHLVLDEADRMLDMGFFDDIMQIVDKIPKTRQTMLFSATMPEKIRAMAKNIMKNPVEINLSISKPADNIIQAAYIVYEDQKNSLLSIILREKDFLNSILIFSATKKNVKLLCKDLQHEGFSAEAIHSDLEQTERELVLRRFKNQQFKILVATDIVARGIDVVGIGMIINYDVPSDVEDYVHRIGRTARAEADGLAITLVTEKDQMNLRKIEAFLEYPIKKLPVIAQLGKTPLYNENSTKKKKKFAGKNVKKYRNKKNEAKKI